MGGEVMSDNRNTLDTYTEQVYMGGKHLRQERLLRGWISGIVPRGDDVLAYVRTERCPGREFRVYLRRKNRPFGSQRNVTMKKLDLPFVTSPVDLNLCEGMPVLFGYPNRADDMVAPIIRESKYDKVLAELKARDGDHPGIKKGHHRWTTP
jgi:hypothetical protein